MLLPPPIDFKECVKMWDEQKKNYKPSPMPEGFISWETIQKEAAERSLTRTPKQ